MSVDRITEETLNKAMSMLMSMTALFSAALALLNPTRPSAASALALNGVASFYGWWEFFG